MTEWSQPPEGPPPSEPSSSVTYVSLILWTALAAGTREIQTCHLEDGHLTLVPAWFSDSTISCEATLSSKTAFRGAGGSREMRHPVCATQISREASNRAIGAEAAGELRAVQMSQ